MRAAVPADVGSRKIRQPPVVVRRHALSKPNIEDFPHGLLSVKTTGRLMFSDLSIL
jgi:hypothetical protein